MPGRKEHACKDQFFYSVGIGSGGVEHDDAFFSAQASRGILLTPAPALAMAMRLTRKIHGMHVLASYEDPVCILDLISDDISIIKVGETNFGDLVQCRDFIHVSSYDRVILGYI